MISRIRVFVVFAMLASGVALAGSAAAQSDDGAKPVTVESPPPRPAVTLPAAITTRPVPPKPVIDELPPDTSDQVLHLKLSEGSTTREVGGRLVSAGRSDAAAVNAALAAFPGSTVEPMFTRSESDLAAEKTRIEARSGRPQADKNLWFRVTLPTGADAVAAINALNALDVVENAYAEPLPIAPPVTPNFEPQQGYRDPAPVGVDADLLASIPGGLGDNVTIIDIEQGWNLNHEDLGIPASAQLANGTPCSTYEDHGTAVLGELVAVDNGFGVTGIVPNAGIGVVHHYTNLGSGCGNNMAQAIDAAHAVLEAGDVILLEAQTSGPDPICNGTGAPNGLIAVEWVPAWYDAIVSATSDGIIVVEAGGNGSCNFDNAIYGSPFPAGRPDSGAIIVGAAASPGGSAPARSRRDYSAHGSRVNLQGWGENVTSAGYSDLQAGPDDQWYTGTFSGTSSASPIVTGAVAALSSIAQEYGSLLTPAQIRSHLIATGTAQDTTSPGALSGNIGPMPDLEAALASMPLCPQDDGLEDDDTQATATPLVRGVTTRAVVCDEDWFSLPVTAGIDVTVDVEFTDAFGDVDINLYDPSGTLVDTSTSTSDNESITHTARISGDYAVKVYGFLGAENIYSVTMSKSICPPDDTMEPNQSLAAATPLSSGVTRAAIACDQLGSTFYDVDWYSLPVQAGQTVDATIEFIDAGGDLTAILYDPSGTTQLAVGNSTTDNEALSHVATETGDYGLLVFGARNEENVYDVTMSARCTDDGFEENDTRLTATALSNDVAVAGHVCSSDDDWFSLPAASGQLVTAVVDFVDADGDVDISLVDPAGTRVAGSTSLTDGEAITWTAASSGTYSLRVYGYNGAENDYTVSLKAGAHPRIRPFGAVANPEGDTGSQIVDMFLYLEDEFGQPYASPTPVTASWNTLDIPSNPSVAHPGEDFVAASGVATFLPGETETTVPLEVLGDTVDEPPLLFGEWVIWAASNPSSNAKINTSAFFGLGLVIIIDDD